MITFQNVSKTFTVGKRKVEAVKNVSFEVHKGDILELLVLVGPV